MRAAAALSLLVAGCAATNQPAAAPASHQSTVAAPKAPDPLRLAGELPAAPASAGPPGTVVDGRYQICLDNGGRVASVKPLAGIAGADDAVMTALHGWSWFVVYRETAPTCFATTVHLAVPRPSQIVRQAGAAAVSATPLHMAAVKPPAWLGALYAGKVVDAVYKVCIADDGQVQSVRPISGVPGADEAFIAALRASSWDLRVGPLANGPFCFGAPMRIDQRHMAATAELPPAAPYPPEMARPERGVSIVVLLHKLVGDAPRLPDALKIQLKNRGPVVGSYEQCITHDGNVATVEPLAGIPPADREITSVLRGWRYELRGPAGMGVCEPVTMSWTVTSN